MIARIRTAIRHDTPVLPGLFMAALILTLPNLASTFWPKFDQRQAQNFWTGLGLVMLPCVLPLSVRRAMSLWLPFAAFIPAALIYILVAGSPLREWTFVVLMETTWHELERFRSGIIAAAALAPITVWYLGRFIARNIPRDQRLGWPLRVVIVLLSVTMPLKSILRNTWEVGALDTRRKLSATFPVGLAVSAAGAWNIRRQMDHRRSAALAVDVKSAAPAGREIYVLVIGESARFGSFQINGYPRETTPLLAKTAGLLSFQDVTAPATVTLMSVPALLTPVTAANVRQAPSLPSVIGVFRHAGFRTTWISTQKKHGAYDTASSIFSTDADEAEFVSGTFAPGAGNYASSLDGSLLKPFQEFLDRNPSRSFIVLHTMGSHQFYCDRYPPEFNHFKCPELRFAGGFLSGHFNEEQSKHLTDAYDNSIRYTDWLVSQVIGCLSATGAVAALYYVSDHGQNMGDSPVMPFGHGTMTRDVVQVPLLIWLSTAYRRLRPVQTAALESHVRTPFGADTTFHTLLNIAGLDCNLLEHRRSAASPDFDPGPRWVRSLEGAVVDYDAALGSPVR